MSQVATRKTAVVEEKRTESPVKDMKKKMAAAAEKEKEKEKEKQAADKNEKQQEKIDKAEGSKANRNDNRADRNEKHADKAKATDTKASEKRESDKSKTEKATEKDKPSVSDKKADNKVEKNGVDKKAEGKEKKDGQEKKDKKDVQEKKDDKVEKTAKAKNGTAGTERPKHNGSKQNGQVGQANGASDSDEDVLEIADDDFPELAYDEGSDAESPTPDGAPSRSFTRRSQVKAARTPETPQPVTEKPADNAASDDSKDSKVLKMNETPNDRKLRSADPDGRKEKEDKAPKKSDKENGDKELEIIEIDDDEPRKPDTNYSKSRVKVSPYRRSTRLADQTTSSVTANYTGNNTTMEMDITESSIAEESLNESYLQGLRAIRGRRSYKQLKEMGLRPAVRDRAAAQAQAQAQTHSQAGEGRPTAPVVGRKRKPEPDDSVEVATEAGEITSAVHSKRMRLLERIALPFRRTLAAHPLPARRNPEIVGINTDLPLTAPVASLDPETLKPEATPTADVPAIAVTPPAGERDGKRCVVM